MAKARGLPRLSSLCVFCNPRRQSTTLRQGCASLAVHPLLGNPCAGRGSEPGEESTAKVGLWTHFSAAAAARAPGKQRSYRWAAEGSCMLSMGFKKLTLKMVVDTGIPTGLLLWHPLGLTAPLPHASCPCLSPLRLLGRLRGLSRLLSGPGQHPPSSFAALTSVMCDEAACRNHNLRIK